MNTDKQNAIKKAYGEHWDLVKDYTNENGWINVTELSWDFMPSSSCFEIDGHNSKIYNWRAAGIGDIINNKGWTKIEDDGSNLPACKNAYDPSRYVTCIFKNGLFELTGEHYCNNVSVLFYQKSATHYQKAISYPSPIY